MLGKNIRKIGIISLATIMLLIPTGIVVRGYSGFPDDKYDIMKIDISVNGLTLRNYIKDSDSQYYKPDPSEPDKPLSTTVGRFATVHFKITITNMDSSTVKVAEFYNKLPANFEDLTNGHISVKNGVIEPSNRVNKAFEDLFVVKNEYFGSSIPIGRVSISLTDKIPGSKKILASLEPGGSLVIEYDAVAQDIIRNYVMDSVDNNIILRNFVQNEVHVELGLYGYDPYVNVFVNPNLKMKKQVALVHPEEKEEEEKQEEDGKEDDKVITRDYKESVVTSVGRQVAFLISVEAPVGREGYNDREYYFKDLIITDCLPEELRYNSSEVAIDGPAAGYDEPEIFDNNADDGSVILKWNFFGKIRALYITIIADVTAPGVGKNIADIRSEISTDGFDFYMNGLPVHLSIPYHKADPAYVKVVGTASVLVDKEVWDPDLKEYADDIVTTRGSELHFSITVTNNGDYVLNDVKIVDVLSSIFEESGELIDDLTPDWTIEKLEIGQYVIKELTAHVKQRIEPKEEPYVTGSNTAIVSANYSYEDFYSTSSGLEADNKQIIIKTGRVTDNDLVGVIVGGINKTVKIFCENPEDESIDVSVNLNQINVTIEDPEGDPFDWRIEGASLSYYYQNPNDESKDPLFDLPDIDENGADPHPLDPILITDYIGNASGTNEHNGTKVLQIKKQLIFRTKYVWHVTAVDKGSGIKRSKTYTFTTGDRPPNQPPILLDENPIDKSENVPIDITDLFEVLF
jgi:uncharacterized repeat protein (TIGR01451 family)